MYAEHTSDARSSSRLALVGPLFMLSGATALLYQVAFGKTLALLFDDTAYGVSAVLAVFMGGLALGSHLGGRLGARVRRPLFVYGLAEIVVGLVCALTPWLFDAIGAAHASAGEALPSLVRVFTALRTIVTGLVVLAPTLAMGVTLPMLAKEVAGRRRGGRDASRQRLAALYGMNTAGGALGALLGAYLFLPRLGVADTMRAAALVSLAIGVVAVVAGRHPRRSAGGPPPSSPESELPPQRLFGLLAMASGVLVFGAEVVDTQLLSLLVGNGAHAFGLMLAVFLTCLSLGAALAHPLERRLGDGALAAALVMTSLAMLVTLPIWSQLPRIFSAADAIAGSSSWLLLETTRAAVAVLVLAFPTTSMGLTFPLLLRRVANRVDVAQQVGRLTAINTLGSIVGSLACGYLLLPALGWESSLRLIAVAFAGCGLLATRWPASAHRRPGAVRGRVLPWVVALAVGLALALPRWNMNAPATERDSVTRSASDPGLSDR